MDSHGHHFDDRPLITVEDGDRLRHGKPEPRNFYKGYQAISTFFLVATAILFFYIGYLLINPYTPLNPLPPPTPLPTPTLFFLPQAVETVESTSTGDAPLPTITASPVPTSTYTPTPQGIDDLQVTLAPNEMPFILLGEEVQFAQNDSDEGCEGIWIAGRIFDLDGAPIAGIPVLVTGEGFQELQISGSWPEFGTSGYRVKVANSLLKQVFAVALIDPTTGQTISTTIEVETDERCQANLILIDFIQMLEYSFQES